MVDVLKLLRWGGRVVGGGALAAMACTSRTDIRDLRGAALPEPWSKPAFVLTDTRGQLFDFQRDTEGYVTLLFFGYTNCPDICPVHMANLGAVLRRLPPDISSRVRVVFVSTDPERDSPERIRTWLDAMGRGFIGLYGPLDSINALQQRIGLAPAVRGTGSDGSYAVGHVAQVIAYTTDNLAHVVYPFGIRQGDWAHDLPKLVGGH